MQCPTPPRTPPQPIVISDDEEEMEDVLQYGYVPRPRFRPILPSPPADRVVTGLLQSPTPLGSQRSWQTVFGRRANTNVVREDTNTGNVSLPSPPRPLCRGNLFQSTFDRELSDELPVRRRISFNELLAELKLLADPGVLLPHVFLGSS